MAPVIDLVLEILERRRVEHEAVADQRELAEAIALSMSKHWLNNVFTVTGKIYKRLRPADNISDMAQARQATDRIGGAQPVLR